MTGNCHVRFWSRAGGGDLSGLGSKGSDDIKALPIAIKTFITYCSLSALYTWDY